jgi:hypothetical protein
MELADLDQNERLALVALIKSMALADHEVSDEEGAIIPEIVDALGEGAYRDAIDTVDQRFADEGELKSFLQGIKRQEARELIYGTVLDMAMSDVVSGHESPLLSWLATTWNVEATVEPSEDEDTQ